MTKTVSESGSSMASSSSASTLGDTEEIPKKDPPPPYPEVEIVKVEEEQSVSEASFDPWDIVEEVDTGVKWKGKVPVLNATRMASSLAMLD